MNDPAGGLLAGILARLPHPEHLVAAVGEPEGDDWYALDAVVDEGHLDAWLNDLIVANGGQRDVAGAYLGRWLAEAVVNIPMTALVLAQRIPGLGAGLWVHRNAAGWFDGVAFGSAAVGVLGDDPDASHPDAVVHHDRAGLAQRYAEALVATLAPLLTAVRRRAPYGLRGLWGAVADDVCGTALSAARRAGVDGWAAWAHAQVVLDHLAARQEHLRTRPTPVAVTWSGGEALFQIKGTCCLYYKTHDGSLDAGGDSYCTTCPFRDDDGRLARLRHQLEQPDRC